MNKEGETNVFYKVDRKAVHILAALAEAPIFKKVGLVQARRAFEGEEIITRLTNGTEETINIAKAGDWVITNPSGEEYLIDQEKFFAQYEPSNMEGSYEAKGYCRAVRNPFGKPIEIRALWGAIQTGDENCMIADVCDEKGENMELEPYLIDNKAFEETYVRYTPISKI